MKISIPWLASMLRRTMSDSELISSLERSGIEIEQYSSPKSFDENIVVGLVKNVIQHPDADRLKIATVENGEEEVLIVCGASNIRIGLKAPLALIGSVLPDGTKITASKLRGIVSNGMLCSARELGLGDNHEGLLELAEDFVVGSKMCDLYPAEGFVDIKTPANRFDLLGAIGVAREVAAMSATKLLLPDIARLPEPVDGIVSSLVDECSSFRIAELEFNATSPTPEWMSSRLAASGLRSINFAVDVTNYVMLETAQPLHAYDASQIDLPFRVRFAEKQEKLTTLDNDQRTLNERDLVISDAQKVIGLAGVRGGAQTEITARTSHIYLEAATFDGGLIRQTARRHNLRTDASARYERGLVAEAAQFALCRAVYLLETYGAAKLLRYGSSKQDTSRRVELSVTTEHASRIVGIEVDTEMITDALNRLEIQTRHSAGTVTALIPWWRPDLKESEDLIEELVRVIGYDRIPSTIPPWRPKALVFDRRRPALRNIREILSGAGLFEVMTYSFVSADQLHKLGFQLDAHLKITNPLSIEQAYLRSSMIPSHIAVANRNRKYAKNLSFYEISTVFKPKATGKQPDEPLTLSVLIIRPKDAFKAAKGLLDLLMMKLNITFEITVSEQDGLFAADRVGVIHCRDKVFGRIGQIEPELARHHKLAGEVVAVELVIDALLDSATAVIAQVPERYPVTLRDLTVSMPEEVQWQDVAKSLVTIPGLRAAYRSEYLGEGVLSGHKHLSIHLTISGIDHTPTEAEASDIETKVRAILRRTFKALPTD
jgi:phenylalanyl-tRNA synthetase beta chain